MCEYGPFDSHCYTLTHTKNVCVDRIVGGVIICLEKKLEFLKESYGGEDVAICSGKQCQFNVIFKIIL